MTLIKGPSGIFECDFRRVGMERLHLSLRTRDAKTAQRRHDAVEKLVRQKRAEMIAQLRSGDLPVERLEAMVEHHEPLMPLVVTPRENDAPAVALWETVDAAAVRYLAWMDEHPNREPASRHNAKFQVKRLQDFVYDGQRIGDRRLDAVPSAAINAYQKSMVDADTPPNTVTVYMTRVGALWNWVAADERKVARETKRDARPLHSPVESDRLIRDVHRRDRVLTVVEANALMARTPAQFRFTVGCGLLAGLRIGEVLHLRPSLDVDVQLGTLHIKRQPGWKPKTKRSVRVVPMADALKALAAEHVARYASELWMHPSHVLEGQPLTQLGFRGHFIKVVEGAGMTYGRQHAHGVVFHTLRHTFASHAVMRGVDLYTVAKLLGDSVKMVEDVYADLSPDHKRTAVAKLASAFTIQTVPENDTETGTV